MADIVISDIKYGVPPLAIRGITSERRRSSRCRCGEVKPGVTVAPKVYGRGDGDVKLQPGAAVGPQ